MTIGDITVLMILKFTITDNRENDFTSFGSLDRTRDLSMYDGFAWPWPPVLFTQTFYYKEIKLENYLGEYSFFAGDRYNSGYFDRFIEDTNGDGGYSPGDQNITSLPPKPLTLTLDKEEITELP